METKIILWLRNPAPHGWLKPYEHQLLQDFAGPSTVGYKVVPQKRCYSQKSRTWDLFNGRSPGS